MLSIGRIKWFALNCSLAHRSLVHGHPYNNILGVNFMPPRSYEALNKKRAMMEGDIFDDVGEPEKPLELEKPAPVRRKMIDPVNWGLKTPIREYSTKATGRCAEDEATYISVRHKIMRNVFKDVDSTVLGLRRQTIRRVQEAIQSKFGPKYRVRAFGSTQYGVSTPKSDLDLAIVVSPTCQFMSEFLIVSNHISRILIGTMGFRPTKKENCRVRNSYLLAYSIDLCIP